jgi:hypothetical protein
MEHHISALGVFINVSLLVHGVIFDMLCSVLGYRQGNFLQNMSI